MKTIILNASPGKNWNTAQFLKAAPNVAQFVGAEVEYVDLHDLNFNGCRSCMVCKRKGAVPRHCYWNDDLSLLIYRIHDADTLIMGSTIYLPDTTSQFNALMECISFVNLSYGKY